MAQKDIANQKASASSHQELAASRMESRSFQRDSATSHKESWSAQREAAESLKDSRLHTHAPTKPLPAVSKLPNAVGGARISTNTTAKG